jgi:hypothetical protein
MVIVLRNGRVNRILRFREKPRKTSIFSISRLRAPTARLHPIHRDT